MRVEDFLYGQVPRIVGKGFDTTEAEGHAQPMGGRRRQVAIVVALASA